MTFKSGSTLPQNHKPPKHNKCSEVHNVTYLNLCFMLYDFTAVA